MPAYACPSLSPEFGIAPALRSTDMPEQIERGIARAGAKIFALKMDVTDVASVRSAVAAAASALSRPANPHAA